MEGEWDNRNNTMTICWPQGKPSVLGMVSGAIAGLVVVTPGSGYMDQVFLLGLGFRDSGCMDQVSLYGLGFGVGGLGFRVLGLWALATWIRSLFMV